MSWATSASLSSHRVVARCSPSRLRARVLSGPHGAPGAAITVFHLHGAGYLRDSSAKLQCHQRSLTKFCSRAFGVVRGWWRKKGGLLEGGLAHDACHDDKFNQSQLTAGPGSLDEVRERCLALSIQVVVSRPMAAFQTTIAGEEGSCGSRGTARRSGDAGSLWFAFNCEEEVGPLLP